MTFECTKLINRPPPAGLQELAHYGDGSLIALVAEQGRNEAPQ